MGAAARPTQPGTAGRRCRRRRSARSARCAQPPNTVVDREQAHRRELLGIARRRPRGRVGRKKLRATMSWPSGEYRYVEVRLGDGARALAVHDGVDERHGRLGEHAHRRADDVERVRTHLFLREQRLVLPREQHVADAALHERVRGRARARVLHGHVAVQLADELLGFRLRRGDAVRRQRRRARRCRRRARARARSPRRRGSSSVRRPTSSDSA